MTRSGPAGGTSGGERGGLREEGRPGGQAAFPKARVVTVTECGSHAPVLAAIGPSAAGEGSGEQRRNQKFLQTPRPEGNNPRPAVGCAALYADLFGRGICEGGATTPLCCSAAAGRTVFTTPSAHCRAKGE
jgi:hypothetical protein